MAGQLDLLESVVLFALVIAYTVFLVVQSRRASSAAQERSASPLYISTSPPSSTRRSFRPSTRIASDGREPSCSK